MDKDTTVADLKSRVFDFCEERHWNKSHNPKDLSIGISTEANELMDLFRFKSNDQMKEMMKDKKKRGAHRGGAGRYPDFFPAFCPDVCV